MSSSGQCLQTRGLDLGLSGKLASIGPRSVPLLMGALGAVGALVLSPALGAAQERPWWEALPGFGRPDVPQRAANEERRRAPEALTDLRREKTPFRSPEMVDMLESAVRHYQAIVSNGGWPVIPGNRMIRPEDNDDRVALLYRRLAVSGELRGRPNRNLFGYVYDGDLEAGVRRFQESCQNGQNP